MKDPQAFQRVAETLNGFWFSQVISTAVRLGLPDALENGSEDGELATTLSLDPDALRRLLRALASIGIFAEDTENPGRWRHTPGSEVLKDDAPGALGARARALGELAWAPWGELAKCVRTGKPGFDEAFGQSFFEYLGGHPEQAQNFGRTMSSFTNFTAQAVTGSMNDVPAAATIVDLGGSQGTMLGALLARHDDAKGVLFDRPEVIEGGAPGLGDATSRCERVAGDFFESVPDGGDIYVLSWILHDWTDEQCVKILKRCVDAMKPDAKLWIVEMVTGPDAGVATAFFDLEMLVQTGGRERSRTEFEKILADAGLKVDSVVGLPAPQSVLVASKA